MARPAWRLAALVAALLAGCSHDISSPPPSTNVEPIGVQMLRSVPELKGQRFSTLLDFETPADEVFLSSGGGVAHSIDNNRGHTGRASLRLAGTKGKLIINLKSLLGTRPFPSEWTLAGAYFYTDKPAQVVVSCQLGAKIVAQNKFALTPGQWTTAMVDLNPVLNATTAGPPMLVFTIDGGETIYCDDVLLVNNTQWLIGSPQARNAGQWSLRRSGLGMICEVPRKFRVQLVSADATPDGWHVDEANAIRARFSSSGKDKSLTVYPDGRSYWGGVYRAMSADLRSQPLWAQQHDSPAQIEIPQTLGRVDRKSAGDANNDGYNEATASYTIIATGPRLEMNIIPRSVSVLRPMLQITGLPTGKALVTIEGKLVERTLRLEDGTLLVEIPVQIDRPTSVNLGIE